MNNEEIITALKENEKPFGLMVSSLTAKAKEIGKEGSFQFYNAGRWNKCPATGGFSSDTSYRLRPDYKEEPAQINVRMIRSEGGISPVANSSIDVDIMWHANKPYVSLKSLEYANRSIANAEYWLKYLNVWGNHGHIKKIRKAMVNEQTVKEEPEIEKVGLEMKYFILKPKSKPGVDVYAMASRAAMLKYADVIEPVNPTLANELMKWAIAEAEA